MRIHRIRIQGFKGVDVEIPWASAMVLFGANDSGKTNILEAVVADERALRGGSAGIPLELDVELDGLAIEGNGNRETFLTWLLADNTDVWWYPRRLGNGFMRSQKSLTSS